MNRASRLKLAQETVEIVERGSYVASDGRPVEIARDVQRCLEATRYFPPEAMPLVRDRVLAEEGPGWENSIEVANETTLAGLARLRNAGATSVAALNFASARSPGGGFLGGSQAQEESLARSSALYASLLRTPEFYERHRASSSMLYSDAMILSPDCPVFRNDSGALLAEPYTATFITSPAPNAGAAAANRPEQVPEIPAVFLRRSEYVLALAAAHGYRNLLLGAWGCGVFRNDPAVVAGAFARHLRGKWAGRFERVWFSVLDTSSDPVTFLAFECALCQKRGTG
jgi:uncharacterized protein (TIGR02452 family)